MAAHFALFLGGLAETSLPSAVALVSLEPLSVVLVAWIAFKIAPRRAEAIGVLLATVGALVVTASGAAGADRAAAAHHLLGDAMVFAAVIVYGVYIAAARGLRDAMPPFPYAGAVYGVATLCLLPLAIRSMIYTPPVPNGTWLAVFALGVIPTFVGHTLVQRAARDTAPSLVALVSPGETVGSLAIGALLLGAWPTPMEAIGAAVVLVGAVFATLGARPV